MTEIARNWVLHVDVGAEWLFCRIGRTDRDADATPPVAQHIWELAERHNIYRIVIELESHVALTSHVVGQLILLHKRCHRAGGVVRICGFDTMAYDVLKIMQLDRQFPNYRNREDAVMGYQPAEDT